MNDCCIYEKTLVCIRTLYECIICRKEKDDSRKFYQLKKTGPGLSLRCIDCCAYEKALVCIKKLWPNNGPEFADEPPPPVPIPIHVPNPKPQSEPNKPRNEKRSYQHHMSNILEKNHIFFAEEYPMHINGKICYFDFCITQEYKLIEVDEQHHFECYKNRNDEFQQKKLEDSQHRDIVKTKWAINNGYQLMRIPYTEKNNFEDALEKFMKNKEDKLVLVDKEKYTYIVIDKSNESN